MKTRTNDFAIRLKRSKLLPNSVRTYHKTMYSPSLKYSLAAIATDEENLNEIQTTMLPIMLQRMGASSKTPTVIRHGPIDLAGMDLFDTRTEVGVENIRYLRHSVYSNTETGKLILINLQRSQQEAGIGQLLFEQPNQYVSYLTPTWVTSVRQYLSKHNITIEFTKDLRIVLRRPHDNYIMHPANISRYSEPDQLDINLVRIYLGVATLADITEESGKQLNPLMYTGEKDPDLSSIIDWPRQETITQRQRNLWKRYLFDSYISNQGYFLKHPLGPWIHKRGMESSSHKTADQSPDPVPLNIPPTTFNQVLAELSPFHKRLINDHHQDATDQVIWRTFRSKKRLEIISDEGLKDSKGTFGWKIILPDRTTLFHGAGPVDGPKESESSTRSELFGLAAPLLIITCLFRWWGLRHNCKLRWLVDSTAAIKQTKTARRHRRVSRYQPDNVDVLALIRKLLREIKRPMTIDWIKGHQDDKTPYDDLPRDAQLNIDVDYLATAYRESNKSQTRAKLAHCPLTVVSVLVNGVRHPGKVEDTIRYHVNGSPLRIYICEKNNWTQLTAAKVDWYSFGLQYRRLTPTAQVAQMKFVHDIQPLGVHRARLTTVKDSKLALCPCCKKATETQQHFLTCPHQRPSRYGLLRDFRKTVCAGDAHPATDFFYRGLLQWLSNPDDPSPLRISAAPDHIQPSLTQALQDQDDIGWHQATKGFISTQWITASSMDPTNPRKTNTDKGRHRISKLLKAIYALTSGIWKARNTILHNKKDAEARRISSVQDAEIRHYHSHPEMLPARDRHYCERSLSNLLSRNPAIRRRWLVRVKRARKSLLDERKYQQALLKRFFPTVHSTRPPKAPKGPVLPYLSPLRKQTTIRDHVSRDPDPPD